MTKRSSKAAIRHSLLIYSRLGQRLRTTPFLIALLGVVLLALGWLADQGILQGGNLDLLRNLWTGWPLIVLLIVASVALFILTFIISRGSRVEVRRDALYVQAGLLPLNISYKRIRQIRLSQLGAEYPEKTLRGSDWRLAAPLLGTPCTVVDLRSWPWPGEAWLHRLWSKFMFNRDGGSLMLVVKEAMILNQQIDGRIAALQVSAKKSKYADPIERAAEMERRQGRR